MQKRTRCLTIAAVAVLTLIAGVAGASSHREAPGIVQTPQVDATDFYMFRSYEPGREGFVTLIANYNPLQDAYGGPNYFLLDPDARYRINIDNSGDGDANLIFEFDFDNELRDIQVPAGTESVSIPLRNAGQVFGDDPDTLANLNVVESYRLKVIRDTPGQGGRSSQFAVNSATGGNTFIKPADNFGNKSFPDYQNYANNFIYDTEIPNCAPGRVFVGQRKDPFVVNLGEVFDLVNIANPIGGQNAESDDLEDANVTSIILEVPIECITGGSTDVVGGWTTALRRKRSTIANRPTFEKPENETGAFRQVSRLGMPLVNELVIGLKDKNRFNASKPANDLQFATYVTNPTLPELLEILFGAAGVEAPNNFPRVDLLATFVTGIAGLNEFGFGEMQRLNVAIPPTAKGNQSRLGVIGGDNAGFPNGRRPGDDVVDIELRVAMGLLCHAFPGAFCNPEDAPSGLLPFTDGARQTPRMFDNDFPYLRTPIAGSPN